MRRDRDPEQGRARRFIQRPGRRLAGWALATFLGVNLALCPPVALGQDLLPKAPPQARPVVIQDATLHTMAPAPGRRAQDGPDAGIVERGSIVFADGVLVWIGAGRPPADLVRGADLVDGTGKHVYPGLICATSSVGLIEIESVDMTQDFREMGQYTPEVRAAVAVNPDSWIIPVTRRNGVLTCGVLPRGGRVAGRAAILRLDAWTWVEMAIEPDAGMVIQWPVPPGAVRGGRGRGARDSEDDASRRPARESFDPLFDQAVAYHAARAADPTLSLDLRLEALGPTIAGARPVWILANLKQQIEEAVTWAVERGLRVVIVGGRDAALCAELLRRHDVPVAITTTHRLPHRRDLSHEITYELPGLLEAAGVRWCLTMEPSEASNARNLPYEAAACIAYGLDPVTALRSITLSAAQILGVDNRLGSLEAGKWATLFMADGDVFELSSTIERAYIDGRAIDLRDKQTELDAKYREKYRQRGLLPPPTEL